MSGTAQPVSLADLVNVFQQSNILMGRLIDTLAAGVAVTNDLPTYTVAALPASAAVGALAYATNGRKSGEGAGLGTGTPVWWDVSGHWFAVWSSAQVTS